MHKCKSTEIRSQSTGQSVFVNELHKGQTFLTGISSNRIRGVYLDIYRRREEQRLEKGEERERPEPGEGIHSPEERTTWPPAPESTPKALAIGERSRVGFGGRYRRI